MSKLNDQQILQLLKETHVALDMVEKCLRRLTGSDVKAELIDLTLLLRKKIDEALMKERGSTSPDKTSDTEHS